ncbi:MAG TPA: glycosyltransferase [Dehalococcoidia bacterium]|nr:glycosyltransferase [Dehalococcoidia bacterium]
MTRRVALVSEHACPLAPPGGTDFGGQNVYVRQLARHLVRQGYEVDTYTRRTSEDDPEIMVWEGGRVVHVRAGPAEPLPKERLLPYMGAFAEELVRAARQRRYDVVHANFWMSAMASLEVKRRLGVPLVVTFHALGRVRRMHQGAADGFPDERFAIEERVFAEADRVIAECPQDLLDMVTLYGADPSRIVIVPCGFDPEELAPVPRPAARREIGAAAGERIVLYVGRMVPRKGVETIVRAMALLGEGDSPGARLLVVGGEADSPDPAATPEIGRLRALARELGVGERVTFAGRQPRERLRYFYSAADVFVTVPAYEPFGITPLEAMACGTPVIGSRVGGIKHTVRDGETGWLVAPDDAAALASAIETALRHPELRELLGRQARAHVAADYQWGAVCERVAAVYEDARRPAIRVVGPARATVESGFRELERTLRRAEAACAEPIERAAQAIVAAYQRGGKLLACGNGGSCADAQHLAAELVGRFRVEGRRPLGAIALGTDATVMTAWSNDCSFEDAFAREVQALGSRGDVLVAFSTSGRSPNVVAALRAARAAGLTTVAVLGGDGGAARTLADVAVVVPSADTQRVQEVHGLLLHVLCEAVEERLFGSGQAEAARARHTGDGRIGRRMAHARNGGGSR